MDKFEFEKEDKMHEDTQNCINPICIIYCGFVRIDVYFLQ